MTESGTQERTGWARDDERHERHARIVVPGGDWWLDGLSDQVLVSSGRKMITKCTYHSSERDVRGRDACLVAFDKQCIEEFGKECANLGALNNLGVGPRLLQVWADQNGCPSILEEDVGQGLDTIIAGDGKTLHAPGTPERKAENEKIMLDTVMQLVHAHRGNVHLGDLRPANICVRRFKGDLGTAPQNIRATLIDFELSSCIHGGDRTGEKVGRAEIYHVLFRSLPTLLNVENRDMTVLDPTPLEVDLGYLAALGYELERGSLALERCHWDDTPRDLDNPLWYLEQLESFRDTLEDFLDYLKTVEFFGYSIDDTGVRIIGRKELDLETDAAPLAKELGLPRFDSPAILPADVTERYRGLDYLPDHDVMELARSLNREYLDAEDMATLDSSMEMWLFRNVYGLADSITRLHAKKREQSGNEVRSWVDDDGVRHEERTLEDKNDYAKVSTLDQAAHLGQKVRAIGCELIPENQVGNRRRVTSLDEKDTVILMRLEHERWVREKLSRGWTFGRVRDDAAKRHPDLVPYDNLSKEEQLKDRFAAEEILELARILGCAVVKLE